MRTLQAVIVLITLVNVPQQTASAQTLPQPSTTFSQPAEGSQQSKNGEKPSADNGNKPLPPVRSLNEPLTDQEIAESEKLYVTPEEKVEAAFAPPPNSKAINPQGLWVNLDDKQVFVDGYVTMREGPLEMFACPIGTKEHESVVATLAKSSQVHAALLAVGARSGTPVQFLPSFIPATGQRIRVWVCYYDAADKFQAKDAKGWIKNTSTKKTMQADWVFSGSGFWKDPNDGKEYYRADGGDMICVSNFSTAMLDVPIASSAEANALQFIPNTDEIPARGTPVRMILSPIPIRSDLNQSDKPSDEDKEDGDPSNPKPDREIVKPSAELLPRKLSTAEPKAVQKTSIQKPTD